MTSKRLNGRTERREREEDWNDGLRDNFISALFCSRNFIAMLGERPNAKTVLSD